MSNKKRARQIYSYNRMFEIWTCLLLFHLLQLVFYVWVREPKVVRWDGCQYIMTMGSMGGKFYSHKGDCDSPIHHHNR